MTNRPRPVNDETEAGFSGDETDQPPRQLAEPSWFHSQARSEPREELVERYRQAWNRNEAGLSAARRASAAAGASALRPSYRDSVQTRPRPPVRFLQELEFDARPQDNVPPHKARTARARRQVGVAPAIAIACAVAVLSGGAVGYVSARYPNVLKDAEALVMGAGQPPAEAGSVAAASNAAAPTTVAVKKPIATATLQVADVTGQTNSLIPLDLHAAPAANGGDIFLKISGLPDTAYLTSGRRDGDKIWALSLDDLKDVKLMVPQAQQNQIDVAVAAFERKTGELAAPVKSMTIALSDVSVVPASAPPPSQTQTPPKTGLSANSGDIVQPLAIPQPTSTGIGLNPQQEAALQVAVTGDQMLERGDIEGARRAYEQAWNGGSAAGAFGLARSYDPLVIRALSIRGASPDSDTAVTWYQRAADAGHAQAQDAIVRLKLKP